MHCAAVAFAQTEAGLPFLQNFRPKDFHGLPQIWDIVQDQRGVMYFANNGGVLEYDGASWRTIPLPGLSEAYSLALDANGQIFVGGNNEVGYLTSDARGEMRFVSLLEFLPQSEHDFGQVWKTIASAEGVFFETSHKFFRLQRAPANAAGAGAWATKVWKAEPQRYILHSVHGNLYFTRTRKIFELREDSLHILLDHDAVVSKTITLMLPYSSASARRANAVDTILVGTRTQGVFWYDGAALQPFETEADAYFRENQISHGVNLAEGRFAFATLFGGVVVIDHNGRLLQIVNKAAGLHNENILHVFMDREDGLWLGTDGGVARIETSTPLSMFTETVGLNGGVYCLTRHRERLYVGTSAGLAYLTEEIGPAHTPVLQSASELTAQTRALLSFEKFLLVGGSDGIFRLDENDRQLKLDNRNPGAFYRSQKYPERVYVGLLDALAVLHEVESKQPVLLDVPGISGDVRYIVEDSTGALWVCIYPNGLVRVELPHALRNEINAAEVKVENFGAENGLPEGWSAVHDIAGRIVFATPNALHRFDPSTRTFPIDSSFGAFFADTSRAFSTLAEDSQKQIWMVHSYRGRDEVGVAVRGADGAYAWHAQPFSRATEFGYLQIIYPDPERRGVVWFAHEEALARYDQASPARNSAVDFSALVRRVTMKNDSVIYGGAGTASATAIAFANNALRFEYSAPTFDHVAATRYQYFLEGFEAHWSDWTTETKKEYTNLSEGEYRFHVRAKNVYAQLSRDGVFAFKIFPPWYRAWWAYGIYLLFAGVAVYGLVLWRVQALHKRAQQLEATIAERTAQVVEQKNRLEEQSHQLQEMDRVKSRFFANISHEFRTPLTLILGPLERVLQGAEKHNSLDDARMMHRNAANLLRLVNQLLDLAKLEAGKLRLQARAGDLVECLKSCIASFDSLARAKKIVLRFDSPHETLPAWFNRMQLEEVFYNVLSNALKFTPEGGEVGVQLAVNEERRAEGGELGAKLLSAPSAMRYAVVSFKDTGLGIPANKLPHVFERFYQANGASGAAQAQSGTGIGLALVKELVELHYGKVEIKSAEGKGTEVVIQLPLGREHLQAEEVVAAVTGDAKIEDRGLMIDDRATSNQHQESSIEHLASSNEQPTTDTTIILLVEDNADMRDYIRRQLASDYKIVEAQHGREGVEQALAIIPDLVISDVMMPEMDGFALCDRLKADERTSHIPIILLTAKAEREDRLEGLQTGADDYLTKPFDARELQLRVKNAIASRRRLQERFKKQMLLRPSEINVASVDEIFLQKAVAAVEAHIEDESFTPEDLAHEVGMSRAQFYRKLRALTNQPAGNFIRSIRLERAADLLKQGAGNIAEVAYRVGFSSHPYFTKCFHEHFGMSPKEYMAKWLHG